MVDRMDNINKEVILANLVKAKLFDRITIEDFFRLASILERIPYVDLPHLKKYENDYYDESGDTELLASTGVIKQTVVGDNKYALSELGIKLIDHGLRVEVDKGSIRQGTEVGLEWANANAITAEEIDQLFEEKEKEKANKKLEDDDAGAFYYDVARGK